MSILQSQSFGDIIQSGQGNVLTINQTIIIAANEVKSRAFKPHSPYFGLSRFEEGDRGYFFGRDRLIEQLLSAVAGSNFTFVAGSSGSGKSSLLSAGLLPQLRERLPKDRFKSCAFTPDRNPFRSLYGSLLGHRYRQQQAELACVESPETLLRLAKELRTPHELWLLIIDQFEEIFTLCAEPAVRAAFLDAIVRLVEAPQQEVKVVLAMRADFFSHLGEHPALATLVERNLCLVKAMQPSELRIAIEQPAALHGVLFEDGLVDTIIKEVQGQPAAMPLLQYSLDLLWQQDQPEDDRTLNISSYAELGGVLGALEKRAEQLFSEESSAQQTALRRIFLRLVKLTREGGELRMTNRPARRLSFSSKEEQLLIDKLIDAKLLIASSTRPGHASGAATVEIAHESLLQAWSRLHNWINEAREVLYLYGLLESDALHWELRRAQGDGEEGAEAELWSGSRLQQALEMNARNDFQTVIGGLKPQEAEFVSASELLRERRLRREREQREREARLEGQREQARQAHLAMYVENGRALLLKGRWMEALAWLCPAYLQGSMDGTLPWLLSLGCRDLERAFLVLKGHQAGVPMAQFSPDGTRILTASHDGTARIWDAQTGALRAELRGHKELLYGAAFSADGSRVVTASHDKTGRLWDASNGKLLSVLAGHGLLVYAAQISADGTRAVTCSRDNTARLWDARDGALVAVLSGHRNSVLSTDFSPDGDWVITTSDDQTARLWNARSGAPKLELSGHTASVSGALFSPDGTLILTFSQDRTVRLWDARTGVLRTVLTGHEAPVRAAAFNLKGTQVVTAGSDRTARIWDAFSGALQATLSSPEGAVTSVQFSPDGECIAMASEDRTARIWDVGRGQLLITLFGHGAALTQVSFSPDGALLLTASRDGTARVWDAHLGAQQMPLPDYQSSDIPGPMHMVFSSDAERVLILEENSPPLLVDGNTGRFIAALQDGRNVATSLWRESRHAMFGAGGSRVVSTVKRSEDAKGLDRDGKTIGFSIYDFDVHIRNATDGAHLAVLREGEARVTGLRGSADGRRIVTLSQDRTARIWNVADGSLLATLRGHQRLILDGSLSSDGERVLTWDPGTVRLWDASGRLLRVISQPRHGELTRVVLSAEGTRFMTGYADGTLHLWDAEQDTPLAVMRHGNRAQLAESENYQKHHKIGGDEFEVSNYQGTVRYYDGKARSDGIWGKRTLIDSAELWDTSAGVRLAVLPFNKTDAELRFCANHRYVLGRSKDGIVSLWLAESGALLATLKEPDRTLQSAHINRQGTRAATNNTRNIARLWEAASGTPLATLQEGEETTTDPEFSQDGTLVITRGNDGVVRLWNADDGRLLTRLQHPGARVAEVIFGAKGTRAVVRGKTGSSLWTLGDYRDYPLEGEGRQHAQEQLAVRIRGRLLHTIKGTQLEPVQPDASAMLAPGAPRVVVRQQGANLLASGIAAHRAGASKRAAAHFLSAAEVFAAANLIDGKVRALGALLACGPAEGAAPQLVLDEIFEHLQAVFDFAPQSAETLFAELADLVQKELSSPAMERLLCEEAARRGWPSGPVSLARLRCLLLSDQLDTVLREALIAMPKLKNPDWDGSDIVGSDVDGSWLGAAWAAAGLLGRADEQAVWTTRIAAVINNWGIYGKFGASSRMIESHHPDGPERKRALAMLTTMENASNSDELRDFLGVAPPRKAPSWLDWLSFSKGNRKD